MLQISVRAKMINYLIKETRYSREQLAKLDDKKLEKWYTEERQANRAE